MTESEGDRAARRVLDSLTGAVAAAVVAELDRTTTWRPANNGREVAKIVDRRPTGGEWELVVEWWHHGAFWSCHLKGLGVEVIPSVGVTSQPDWLQGLKAEAARAGKALRALIVSVWTPTAALPLWVSAAVAEEDQEGGKSEEG